MKKGDYVVATKYSDGDPKDHFVVGFFKDMTWHGRYSVVDNDGRLFRHNGFRRAEVVSVEIGNKIVNNMAMIENSDRSVWDFVADFKNDV